jgi:hypothetical protein
MWSGNQKFYIEFSRLLRLQLFRITLYKELFSRFCFLPFSVETLGPWGADAKKFITLLGKKISSMSNDNKSTLYLTQRISLAIQRGNAASVLGTIPQSPDLEEIFYILK